MEHLSAGTTDTEPELDKALARVIRQLIAEVADDEAATVSAG